MYQIIANPASRSGRGMKIWKELEPLLLKQQVVYSIFFTKGPGDAAKEAERLSLLNVKINLIILGGDGTVNEVLQGLKNPSAFIIGYIPTGSSNDLARDLKIPRNPAAALDLILHTGTPRPMDIGILQYNCNTFAASRLTTQAVTTTRLFADSCGIGFDAAVCEEALSSPFKDTLNRLGLGKLTYLMIALKQIIAARKIPCEIYLDDARQPIKLNRFLFIAGMIHQYEGGGFKFCPGADYRDGLLDICVVGSIPKIVIFLALPTAFFGKHYFVKGISRYYASSLRIKTATPLWVHTDGEVYTRADDITMRCVKDSITFIS